MTFDDFKILVKGLKAVYTSANFLPDADSVHIWYNLLKDLDYQVTSTAIQKYILTNKFPPTIADIREMVENVSHGERLDWSEGWQQAMNAISRYGMYRPEEALQSITDKVARRAVERLGFQNLCTSENINQDRANFRMIYEQLAERAKADAQLPTNVKVMIENIREQNTMLLGGGNGK